MADTYHDGNHTANLIAVKTDGVALVNVIADPSTHALGTVDGSAQTDNGPYTSRHDANHVPVLMAVSSVNATVNGKVYVQGVTPVAVYADASGNILTESV